MADKALSHFPQYYNQDPQLPTAVVDANGSTRLTKVGTHFFLSENFVIYYGNKTYPSLKYAGADYVAGQFGTWTPVGAERTASGYKIAWKDTSNGLYTAWNTDADGNYVSNAVGVVSGADVAFQSLETSFQQDLNGDGHIGLVTTAVETQGSTDLTHAGGHYFLYDGAGSGPSLKYAGADYIAGQFGTWTPVGAERTASGYKIAWKDTSNGLYTAGNTDADGNYVSNAVGVVSGADVAFQSLETSFQQDLNGDGHIGLATTAVETQGSTDLRHAGGHYFLYDSAGSGPSLKYAGADYVAGQFGTWTPVGAEKTASGYKIAWKDASSGLYAAWNTDADGNYVSNAVGAVSGADVAFQSLETSFQQDLNGDGHIGLATTAVETQGSTDLRHAGGHYFLYDSAGSGPSLKYAGADYVAGQFGTWTPVGAEKTASGYKIAWKDASSGLYTAWNTDADGNYVSNAVGAVSGADVAFQSLETSFQQDLNGDGHIGLATTAVETQGSTDLRHAGGHYFLYDSAGSGPSLKYAGADYVTGQFGKWTPVGAEKTASGYKIAWRDASSGLYTAWNTDADGNYVSNAVGAVSGADVAFQSLETSFQQDLNKDGYVGLVLNGSSGGQTLNATSSTTTLIGGPNNILNGGFGADTFVFQPGFGSNTINDFAAGTDVIQFDHTTFADVADVQSHMQQIGSDVLIAHDPQNVVTLHDILLANLHTTDFHIV